MSPPLLSLPQTILACLFALVGSFCFAEKPRVLVSTDIGGTDPDDFQSLVHLLVCADSLEIEGLISSPYGPGRAQHVHEVVDAYAKDFPWLSKRAAGYPSPEHVRSLVKQGAVDAHGFDGVERATEGSEWIVARARIADPRPLWVLVWGGLDDLAQALHDAPDILPKLRVYFIGGPNKMWSTHAYSYIEQQHPKLWMIEANSTYRGWFVGGDQTGEWGNKAFVEGSVAPCGALGALFAKQLRHGLKMGDTPSVMRVLGREALIPEKGNWGGKFVRVWDGRKSHFDRHTDEKDTVEVFGEITWKVPLPSSISPDEPISANVLFDSRVALPAKRDGNFLRFRFSPRDAKAWKYEIQSPHAALNGQQGAFTAILPANTTSGASAKPNWWTDDQDAKAAEQGHAGIKHINAFRRDFLQHFSARMDRCRAETGPLAFPTAEGYGRWARGGRGGRVLHVTNLNDAGPGSLRDAVEQTGPRTVVFDVSGMITLESKLLIKQPNSFLTIAGHTAPGKGICLRKYNLGLMGATQIIIRYLRVRPGNLSGQTLDGMGMASANHCIFDHCSISWTQDEAFSSRSARDITLQRCLISEALNAAGHKKYPPGTQHGYAASIGGDVGSFHHNLLAHNAGRNWSLAGGLQKLDNCYAGRLDIRNNVIYNWRSRTTDGGAHEVNFVGNYYKPGPATKHLMLLTAQYNAFPGSQRYFIQGNVLEGHVDARDNKPGFHAATENQGTLPTAYSPWSEKEFFPSNVATQSAEEAYENVLADVGCNKPRLDEHDLRVISEVRHGTAAYRGSVTGLPGLPDSQDDVGGWESYPEEHRPVDWDKDRDGMPDAWELKQGLNPADPQDGNADQDGDGYTNLEEFLQ